jgi:hypothetical protein
LTLLAFDFIFDIFYIIIWGQDIFSLAARRGISPRLIATATVSPLSYIKNMTQCLPAPAYMIIAAALFSYQFPHTVPFTQQCTLF